MTHLWQEATGIHLEGGTWMFEYGRGFIPSALPFAIGDQVFGTVDYYNIYKIFKVYTIAIVQEMSLGNV